MASIVPALDIWGVPAQDIRYEAFGPACVPPTPLKKPTPASDETSAFEIRFARSGRTIVWDGRDANLLDFSERHGVDVDSGCRSGSCGSCETRLVSGSVLYDHQPDHETAPKCCLLCVGVPQTALVLEA
jgi:ferredoxin